MTGSSLGPDRNGYQGESRIWIWWRKIGWSGQRKSPRRSAATTGQPQTHRQELYEPGNCELGASYIYLNFIDSPHQRNWAWFFNAKLEFVELISKLMIIHIKLISTTRFTTNNFDFLDNLYYFQYSGLKFSAKTDLASLDRWEETHCQHYGANSIESAEI